ncbi:hypothetical protein L195_g016326 [Trifolium pratense]|uniref:Uncharacterized protein n=2 Tax=Trifolium pratense TaxID=57577 RepID=A0A2K3MQU9_TRIPR|nr:hypothetical protein L195_g016265 [Trifolium pratense]PNX93175.1 hypothetical protein L195_g016326 [Trifolium pratense]
MGRFKDHILKNCASSGRETLEFHRSREGGFDDESLAKNLSFFSSKRWRTLQWVEDDEATTKAAGSKDTADNNGGCWLEMIVDTPKKRNMEEGSFKTLRTEERIMA